jgi:hypothetical protein
MISFPNEPANRFCCSGSVIPNAVIASFIACSASGASTYPIIAAGVERMRVIRHSYSLLLGCFGMLPAIQSREAEHDSSPLRHPPQPHHGDNRRAL